MKFIRFYLVLIIGLLLLSCNKESASDNQTSIQSKSKGLVQHLFSDSAFSFTPITQSNVQYLGLSAVYASDEGFLFKPGKDIHLSSVGCRAAQTGTYQIRVQKLRAFLRIPEADTLLMESITINNTNDFQYKDLSKDLLLSKDQEYVIYYHAPTLYSVFIATYNNWDRTGATTLFPLTRDGVTIEGEYHAYYASNGFLTKYETGEGSALQGLVDFKFN